MAPALTSTSAKPVAVDGPRRAVSAPAPTIALEVVQIADAYLSLKTLAAYSGLSIRRLRGYLTTGASPLPFYRIGGRILVRRSDYDGWAGQFRRDAVAIDALVDDILQDL